MPAHAPIDTSASGPLLRLDLRAGTDGACGRAIEWLETGGRVLVRGTQRVEVAELVRRALGARGGEQRHLVVIFGERSLVLALRTEPSAADEHPAGGAHGGDVRHI